MDNPAVRSNMIQMAKSGTGNTMTELWSMEQVATMNQGKFINQSLAQGLRTFGEEPFKP